MRSRPSHCCRNKTRSLLPTLRYTLFSVLHKKILFIDYRQFKWIRFPFNNFSSLDEFTTIPNAQSHRQLLSAFIFYRNPGESNSKANKIHCLEHKMRSRSIIIEKCVSYFIVYIIQSQKHLFDDTHRLHQLIQLLQ